MATANILREDNYELELNRLREKIKNKFVELIHRLVVRENELLRELDNILASYLSYRSELEKVNEKKMEIEKTKTVLLNEFANSPIKSVHENIIRQLNTELKSIETSIQPKLVSFESESMKMFGELNKLDKLIEKVRSGIDYKSKNQPLVSICEKGKGMEQLNYPLGITADNISGNIYIADQSNNCVKVFDSAGKYLFKFGDNEDDGKMEHPRGVAICGDKVLTSQGSHCILNYQLNGKFISRIGREGKGELEFNLPFGLTIDDSNGDIYVSDRLNNRIQVLSEKLSFKSQFGKYTLSSPRDVKLSKEHIFVLDNYNPCLHLFNYQHILQKRVISRGEGELVIRPCYFFIDHTDTILIADSGSNSIKLFNTEFELFHKIPVTNKPTGITVDNQGRVIVVTQADRDCLQIF